MSRQTGFPAKVRTLIRERAGANCERCGDPHNVGMHGIQVHHRRPRGMGGTRRHGTNGAANGLYLCGMCHRVVENNREVSLMLGQLVPQHKDPHDVPVLYSGEWVLLDDDGYTYRIPAPVGGVA